MAVCGAQVDEIEYMESYGYYYDYHYNVTHPGFLEYIDDDTLDEWARRQYRVGEYVSRWVETEAGWTEEILVKEAWEESVLVSEAWEETVFIPGYWE